MIFDDIAMIAETDVRGKKNIIKRKKLKKNLEKQILHHDIQMQILYL